MNTIYMHALNAYDAGGADIMWCYLSTLIMRGDIDEGTAERIADAVEMEG